MEYMSVKETAARWGISERSVRNYCAAGRVRGAFFDGENLEYSHIGRKTETEEACR